METSQERQAPVGKRLASNLVTLREARHLSVRALSERLSMLGHPLLPSGITKIEAGRRRVDADDLVALALALDVTPNRLLLDPAAGDDKEQLTPVAEVSTAAAWAWACGDRELGNPWEETRRYDLDRAERFRHENRPHDPGSSTPLEDLEDYERVLAPLRQAVSAAREAGLSLEDITGYVRLTDIVRGITATPERGTSGRTGNGVDQETS